MRLSGVLRTMAASNKIVEGVFAINKPPSLSSAQVLRDLQTHFNPSPLFAPWLARERDVRAKESRFQHNRRSRAKRGAVQVKIGHGGTLDPLATGVLICGVGKGTKELQQFLECTKSYEAVVLFGCATDTYDRLGKIVARASVDGVTRERVRDALAKFRGKIMQRPPVYSALRVQGKRLYEYAREGKEVPVEIQERPVEVLEMELVEWMDGGTHSHKQPEEEAPNEEKVIAEKLLNLQDKGDVHNSAALKRKRDGSTPEVDATSPDVKKPRTESSDAYPATDGADTLHQTSTEAEYAPDRSATDTEQAVPEQPSTADTTSFEPPAAKIRMTVTSGFYVRSLCHDLGEAVGSLAIMAELVRTRQGEFTLGQNVLEYNDLEKGEEVWAPQVDRMLHAWNEKGKREKRPSLGTTDAERPV